MVECLRSDKVKDCKNCGFIYCKNKNDLNINFDLKDLFIAIWLHENYESRSKEFSWNTQSNCKVKFDNLPVENKKVMLSIARDINFNLAENKKQGIKEGCLQGQIDELKFWLNDMKETMMRTNTSYSGLYWADKMAKKLKELK